MSKQTEERSSEELPAELDWVVQATRIMDTAFKVPGTKYSFGIDPLIGLIPFAGETITVIVSGTMVFTMARHGVAPKVLMMMFWNILLDWSVGSIPFIGDLFDLNFKANRRNLDLLRAHYQEGKYSGRIWPVLLLAAGGLISITLLAIWGTFSFGNWLWGGF